MCGIAGVVDHTDVAALDAVERQVLTLDHRGPDSVGVYAGRGSRLGQARLAVIDLVTGDPPITNEDKSIGVALNGEIYNFQPLRDRLRSEGHKFTTEGDTEVIAHLAESLDPVCLAAALDGMFAVAVWDDARQRLVLARDRLGKKPLYYWTDGRRLVFGSEIKAVLAAPHVPRRLDPGAVPAYLTFGYVPTPRTFFDGIRSVPPGHVLVFDRDGLVLEPYWTPPGLRSPSDGHLDIGLAEAAREVRRRLASAVEQRLIADVPLGAFLSGGVDSSAIVGLMASAATTPVRTFTIGFEDSEGFDERPYARTVAERFGTDHVEFVVQPHAVDLVERLVHHYDQPFGDSSAVPTFLLSELTRRHVTVALCGDGGDEVFAGYERFTGALIMSRYGALLAPFRGPLTALLSLGPLTRPRSRASMVRRFLDRTSQTPLDAFMAWNSFFPPERRRELLGDDESWATDAFRATWAESEGWGVLDRLLDLNMRTYLLDDLLPKVDRMAMAHGLEVRSPFLDHHLVEFAATLPAATKARGLSRKRVLKAAVADLLPPEILRRRKRGFGVPLDRWFRTDLAGYLDAMIGASDARVRAHVASEPLDRLLAEHRDGVANHGHPLWALLTLEVFLRREGW